MKLIFRLFYWFLSFTWGFLMSFVGLIFFVISLFIGGKTHKNGCSIVIEIGGNWGGLSLGCFAFCGNYSKANDYWFQHTRRHEFGHSIQNAILGPFFIFIVALPSAIRYHYNNYRTKLGKVYSADWYDSIWFEGTATKYGTKVVNWLEK